MPRTWEDWFGVAIQVTIGALLFELAAGSSFGVLEVALLALVVLFAVVTWQRWRLRPQRIVGTAWRACGRFWGVPACIIAYVAVDLAGMFTAPHPGRVFEKYKVVLLMLFVTVCILICCNTRERVRALLAALAIAAGGAAVVALLNGPWLKLYPVYYTLRLTLRRDYNMFATAVLLGYLCAVYLVVDGGQTRRNGWLLALDTVVTVPVLYLSSSRRVFLLLPVVLAFWLVLLLAQGKSLRRMAAVLGTTVLVGVAVWGLTALMEGYMHGQFERYGSYGPTGNSSSGAGSAAQRYETLTGEGMLAKRTLIWGIAWEDYQSFTLPEKLFGRGFGYNIHLYDVVNHPQLEQAYAHLEGEKGLLSAHNFVLADLLDGGIVKAAVGVACVVSWVLAILSLLRRQFVAGAFYGWALGLVVVGSLISNRYGLLYDKGMYLFVVLLLITLRLTPRKGKGETACGGL